MDTQTGRIYHPDEIAAMSAEARAEFDALREQRRVVEVSEQVARQQLAGQRIEERRRKRKVAKAARRRNRGR